MHKKETPMATNVCMPQDRLLRIIDNNKEESERVFVNKKKKPKKVSISQQEKVFLN